VDDLRGGGLPRGDVHEERVCVATGVLRRSAVDTHVTRGNDATADVCFIRRVARGRKRAFRVDRRDQRINRRLIGAVDGQRQSLGHGVVAGGRGVADGATVYDI